MKINNSTMFC